MDLATVLLLTVRGIPIVFYGDEQYLARYVDCDLRHPQYCDVPPEDVNSSDDDPYNRAGMAQWSEQTPAFKIIRILSGLREHSPAIQQGTYRMVYADQDALAFERQHQHETVFVRCQSRQAQGDYASATN